jgi:hypothetical protein
MKAFRMIALAAVLAGLVSAEAALACTCAPPPGPQESLTSSDAVFTGTVVSVTPSGGSNQVVFQVESVYKNAKCGQVTIVTALDEAACGYTFQVGTSYLVYASRQQGKLSTGICSRTQPTSSASGDLTALGQPKTTC